MHQLRANFEIKGIIIIIIKCREKMISGLQDSVGPMKIWKDII